MVISFYSCSTTIAFPLRRSEFQITIIHRSSFNRHFQDFFKSQYQKTECQRSITYSCPTFQVILVSGFIVRFRMSPQQVFSRYLKFNYFWVLPITPFFHILPSVIPDEVSEIVPGSCQDVSLIRLFGKAEDLLTKIN